MTDPVAQAGVDILAKEFPVDSKQKMTTEQLIAVIGDYDALVVRSETKVTKEVIEAATNLKVIGRAGVGVDNINVEAATMKGIIVLNAPEGNTIAATEHTVAMMLAMARNIPQAYCSLQNGLWERPKFTGVEVRGKTLGVLGLGRIGSGVAKRALAFEMKILAYDPFIRAEQAEALGVELADLDTIYARADFITMHLPLTAETKRMINRDAFAKMKKGVRIINVARGGVIDETDLAEAIEQGIVAGAAIDVFEKEPVDPANLLLKSQKVIATPHLGASTAEAQVGVAVDVAHGVIAALKGEPVTTAVNMAPIPAHVLEVIRPYFNLSERMGCLAATLAPGRIQSVEVEYAGNISEVDTKTLTVAVIRGALSPFLQESINYVNAPGMAKSRGIKIKEVKSKEADNFSNLIKVRITTDKDYCCVKGTLFGREGRIVMINDYHVDFLPQGWLMIGPHIDRPGMIGKVGTILGIHRINIASMQVGRSSKAGNQVMVLAVESAIPQNVLTELKAVDGILGATMVNFESLQL